GVRVALRSVSENAIERRALGRDQVALGLDEVPEISAKGGDAGSGEGRQQLGDAKRRQGIAPAERQKLGHRCGGGRKAGLYAACPIAAARPAALQVRSNPLRKAAQG